MSGCYDKLANVMKIIQLGNKINVLIEFAFFAALHGG
jgi:hypothetical protein